VRLKWVATELGMERLILKKGSCLCYFLSDQQSDFFQGQQFQNLLTQIQKNADRMVLKEKSTPKGPILILSISEIKEVRSLTQLLEQLAHTN
jgi:transcription-repair coupling factor (superfamily II helicase)